MFAISTNVTSPRRRRAFAIIYVGLLMFALLALVSLAVDMGRLRVARVQLATAADAAALAGAQKIPSINYTGAKNDAGSVAFANTAITGTGNAVPVVLSPTQDIEFGLYRNGGTFTALGATEPNGNTVQQNECNAIHVTARRTTARGNPIGLFFAQAVGVLPMDITCQAIAVARGVKPAGFGLIGLNWIHMNGTTNTDSYNAAAGGYGGGNIHQNGTVASNGTISMVGNADIEGDARYGVGINNPSLNANWQAPLDAPLNFPPATVPAGLTKTTWSTYINPSQGHRSGKTVNIGDGSGTAANHQKYWFDTINLGGNPGNLAGNGYLDIYVTGSVDMTGGSVLSSGSPALPAKITIYVVGPYSVDLGGGGELDAHVYAPQSDVTFHGTNKGGFYGWIIGKTLDIKGNSELHYDESLLLNFGSPRGALVK